MAIQAQLNYNAPNVNQIGFGGSEFSLINNNGGVGIGIDQSYVNNLQSQKDFNQQALFHHQHQQQQSRSQSFLAAHMAEQKQEIDQFIKIQVRYFVIKNHFLTEDSIFKSWALIKVSFFFCLTEREVEICVTRTEEARNGDDFEENGN